MKLLGIIIWIYVWFFFSLYLSTPLFLFPLYLSSYLFLYVFLITFNKIIMKKTLSLFNISTIISFPFVLLGVRETNTYLKCICDIWLSWKQIYNPIKPTKCIHHKILFKTGLKWPIVSICWTSGSNKLYNLGGGLCNFFWSFRSLSSFWLLYQQ